MRNRRVCRILFVLLLVTSATALTLSYRSTANERGNAAEATWEGNLTVISTQVFREWANEGKLLAVDEAGRVVYRHDEYSTYHDVDPSPEGAHTALFVGAQFLGKEHCDSVPSETCARQIIERVNLSTGETTRLYSTTITRRHKWHDVDRINATHYLVADIEKHRVFVLDVESGETEWEWRAEEDVPTESGGKYPQFWTHLNDVELLSDGRVMVDLRNQDQVAFIHPETGLQENWSLGRDDAHDVLYEQHNPDYIPAERGGPAVVAADSENNRIVEYQRTTDGNWTRTWTWTDAQLQWPRDADRLPNGNTLVTDSNGNRVVEVTPDGEVVWSVRVDLPYEAERLGTGDESAGGPSSLSPPRGTEQAPAATSGGVLTRGSAATARSGPSAGGEAGGPVYDGDVSFADRLAISLKEFVPPRILSGVLFVLPSWIGVLDLISLATALAATVAWALVEFRWAYESRTVP